MLFSQEEKNQPFARSQLRLTDSLQPAVSIEVSIRLVPYRAKGHM